jgi:putative Ca2+/H+ antiporter (TMEM165/GDT1 family)
MDWKLALTTFAAIFLAEMGDKTQLSIITLASSSRKPLTVFFGGAAALVLVTALGAALGELVTRYVPAGVLTKAAAILFVAIGIWTWFKD